MTWAGVVSNYFEQFGYRCMAS